MTPARRRSPNTRQVPATPAHVRRAYTDGRHGQLHLTTAYPSGGGFDERVPLVCLHPAAASGRWFHSLLPELGRDRSAYAPDLPAHGQSDPVTGADLGLKDFVLGIGDFIDSMRLRSVDLLGLQLGAAIAVELALQRPQQVRRVVLAASPETGPAAASQMAKYGNARTAAVSQQTLLVYPADAAAGSVLASASPQHTTTRLVQTCEEIFGNKAQDLARELRAFLDR